MRNSTQSGKTWDSYCGEEGLERKICWVGYSVTEIRKGQTYEDGENGKHQNRGSTRWELMTDKSNYNGLLKGRAATGQGCEICNIVWQSAKRGNLKKSYQLFNLTMSAKMFLWTLQTEDGSSEDIIESTLNPLAKPKYAAISKEQISRLLMQVRHWQNIKQYAVNPNNRENSTSSRRKRNYL